MRVAPGAWRRALPLFLAALPALVLSPWLALALAVGGYATLAFLRDPTRSPPASGVVSPADGRVSVVREEGDRLRVGVFMSPLDVHVNRAPLPGRVVDVTHEPGGHWPAFSKESERNERVTVTLETGEDRARVVLIAGAVARRITPYVAAGDDLSRGDRLGHIAFGSRADVVLPTGVERDDLRVREGDRVRAGESVLATRD